MIAIAVFTALMYCIISALLIKHWKNQEPSKPLLIATAATAILHGVYTYLRSICDSGVDLSLFSASNFISLTLVLLVIVISALRPIQKLTSPILLLAATNIAFSLLNPEQSNITPYAIASHVLPSLLAYSLFSFAAAHAVVLWFQNHALKTQQLNKIINVLPPLDALESALFMVVTAGFVLLTSAMITGTLFIEDFWDQRLAHKTFFSITAWLVFATLLLGRKLGHWRGNSAIKWTLSGYGLLVIGYFGSKFVLEYLIR